MHRQRSADQLTLLRGESVSGALKNGWNHFEFDLSLSDETQSATLSVNGAAAVNVPVEAEIGDYICYVHIVCQGAFTYYLDAFLVDDTDDSVKLKKEEIIRILSPHRFSADRGRFVSAKNGKEERLFAISSRCRKKSVKISTIK